jgi:hypothetical protein
MKTFIFAACVILAAVLPAGPALHTSRAEAAHAAPAAQTCPNFQLLLTAQASQGAAGHVAIIYRIHNLSGRTCTLYGYPGIQLLDRRFQTLRTTVHRGGSLVRSIPLRLVRLGAHGNAYFTLVYSDVPVNNRPCQAAAAYVMIWAPNAFLPVVTYAAPHGGTINSCTGDLTVSPVTAVPRYS